MNSDSDTVTAPMRGVKQARAKRAVMAVARAAVTHAAQREVERGVHGRERAWLDHEHHYRVEGMTSADLEELRQQWDRVWNQTTK